ncbi:hypothetical protein ACNSOL_01310 [Aliarcobacter lanthieri]|uniref:hypothetical protein n=1 Tax=Aliarcobacter lanthieri TaxID=1355374 RepID=UPI003AACB035
MKIRNILLLAFSFLLVGCAQKQSSIIFKPKYVCYELEQYEVQNLLCSTEQSENSINIDLDEDDVGVFISRCNELKEALVFYKNQVDRYNAFCKKQVDKNFLVENIKEDKI